MTCNFIFCESEFREVVKEIRVRHPSLGQIVMQLAPRPDADA
jgi:hypothetical protein